MDVATVLDALGSGPPAAGDVLLRLVLMAADQVTGEQAYVSSFVKRISMPPPLVGPDVKIALELLGERRVFTPSTVVWDETHRVYIVEIVWVVADHTTLAEPAEPETAWPVV